MDLQMETYLKGKDWVAKRTQRLSWPSTAKDVIRTSEVGSVTTLVIRQSVGFEPMIQALADAPVDVEPQALELKILTSVLQKSQICQQSLYTIDYEKYRAHLLKFYRTLTITLHIERSEAQ